MKRYFGVFSLGVFVTSTAIAAPNTHNNQSSVNLTSKALYTANNRLTRTRYQTQPRVTLAGYSRLLNNTQPVNSIYGYQQKDILKRLTAIASNSMSNFSQSGLASWYGASGQNRHQSVNMNDMTASHHTLRLGSLVKVTNQQNGKSVIVKINNRMPASNKRMIDVSFAAAKKLGIGNKGIGNVTIERVHTPSRRTL